jgi:hypothetical protein
MSITASVIAIVILLAALLLMRRTQKSISERPAPKREAQSPVRKTQSTKFHAVSIRLGSNACTAAREIQGERFLASEAPQMPLPDCDASDCKCRFVHYKDRRTKDNRRNPYSGTMGITTGNLKQEHRTGKDRRESSRDD